MVRSFNLSSACSAADDDHSGTGANGEWSSWWALGRYQQVAMMMGNVALTVILLLLQAQFNLSRVFTENSSGEIVTVIGDWDTTDKQRPACSISLNKDLSIAQPLLLQPANGELIFPTANSTIIPLALNEELELYCSHGFSKTIPTANRKSITVSCDGDDEFLHQDDTYNISQLTCKGPVFHMAQRTGKRCYNNATVIRVGFDLGNRRFVKLYEVCFDEDALESHYVKYELTAVHAQHQRSVKRPAFLQGNFYADLKMSKLYTFAAQRETLGKILGSQDRADALLNSKQGLFFARGHLAAKSDFVFGSHQRASFWFMNVAPQWQRFNGFNWQRIEIGVKEFVARQGLNVTVYTGTYGVLQLPDANGDLQEIFLDFDPNGVRRIPVPKLYYKALVDEENSAGIVLVGVNNPHITLEELHAQQYILCDDVSNRIDWLGWKRDFIPGGYSYACDVNEFNRITGHLMLDEPIRKLLV